MVEQPNKSPVALVVGAAIAKRFAAGGFVTAVGRRKADKLAPFGGATFRFSQRTGWGNAMYHLLRCDEFGAAETLRCGFVQEVVAPGAQIDRALALAAEIAACAPLGVQATKAAALEYVQHGEAAAVARIPQLRHSLLATADFREGLASFTERRPARFQGK